ncbi:MAG: universal stress protein [Desulfobacterales bacterium]|nr:universal stress protein [Desulfobacterales bacterium]
MLPIKKIVTTTDFSDPSRVGGKAAVEVAEKFGAELILVHVLPPLRSAAGATTVAGYYLPTVEEEMAVEAAGLAEDLLKEAVPETITSGFRVLNGRPAEQIADLAEKESADLIVIATHGESNWKDFFTGSVTERVIRRAKCPVLAVTRPE